MVGKIVVIFGNKFNKSVGILCIYLDLELNEVVKFFFDFLKFLEWCKLFGVLFLSGEVK